MPAPQPLVDALNKLFDDKAAADTAATAATQADADAKSAADKATKAHKDANDAASGIKASEQGFITALQTAIDGAPVAASAQGAA